MRNIIDESPEDKFVITQVAAVSYIDKKDLRNKDLLDIGCGHGWFELFSIRNGVHKVTGLDISEELLSVAKKHISDKKVSFKKGSAIKLPFNDRSFDTIVAIEVLEHIPPATETVMFREINRVLKKNGVLYLSTPSNSFFSVILDPAWWLMGHRHYSKQQLTKYGSENNLTLVKSKVIGGWWSLIAGLNMYIAKWLFHRKRFFEDFFIKKLLNETDHGFLDIRVKYEKL
ncbi:hypothetical protein A3D81_00530 [Candidatus Curtissbacteria bacterium RIFCSPHIGHO2_02_FULL_40_17]|uniref:Methyltransferase type 11 domain-containing protein n=4 Tax=Candidatus Curtissiibacteriota TaxID=1752717 RepID=A0A1F5GI68_9BACT|nr:MAG: hypothetical protein A2693_05085 [Candidatus Curtissbacteria bacterium RIFCSPHIGHO2_01_FULL_40_12]OGD91581.1 MAG: hypothetical protein A3D81_00530 [Candidatus Curtissbacteria bacterium RIFCSPHIGHO2_02_FULL_40_17]OGE03452.1 MAG: hypothetical protein A3F45_04440 [Candidatus Curtissbacteria bacterium RIFCSPHIGHO2_12_FULL_41_17]OGE07886.1 MAG: hypothetical protein A3I53_04365 [Candidatus Curtissbacteria bacterium RIFCSPLOWO2_02_FULL_40_13b]